MTCLTPDLSSLSSMVDSDRPVIANVSFIMDAVGGLVSGRNPALRYFTDPVVHHFDGSSRVKNLYEDDTYLEIKVWLYLSTV